MRQVKDIHTDIGGHHTQPPVSASHLLQEVADSLVDATTCTTIISNIRPPTADYLLPHSLPLPALTASAQSPDIEIHRDVLILSPGGHTVAGMNGNASRFIAWYSQ